MNSEMPILKEGDKGWHCLAHIPAHDIMQENQNPKQKSKGGGNWKKKL